MAKKVGEGKAADERVAGGSAWSAEEQRILFEHGSVGIFKVTPGGRIVQVNRALARLLGYDSPEELAAAVDDLGRQVYVDPTQRAELVRRLAEHKRIDDEVVLLRRRDGRPLWVKQSARLIEDEEGRARYCVGALVDVTSEVEALEALRLAERSYREIFENVKEGIFRSTLDGHVLRANPSLVRLNGYDSEAELLAAVRDIAREWYVEPGRREEFVRQMERDGRVENFVSEVYRHRTRERIWIQENARLVRDEAGAPLYYEGSIQEITDRKRAEAELLRARLAAEDANRAKSAFLANMSHELRTPLNAIIGFAEVMLSGCYGPVGESRYVEYLQDIRSSGLLLLQLLNDILDLSKVEARKIELDEEPVDLAEVAADCLRMLSSRTSVGGVVLEPLAAPDGLPSLLGDERRLRQVVLNLLSNAVKYNRRGGWVRVALARETDGGLRLTVADGGRGIEAADLERVFEPFVQLDHRDGDSGSREGVGLGLPLARQLVELHGGSLRLSSRPGQGTEAEALFPAQRCVADAGSTGRRASGG